MKLARQLMDTLSDEWDLRQFRDTYTDVLRQIIDAKVERRRQKTTRVAVRKGTTLLEMQPRPSEIPGVTECKIGQQ